MIRRRPIPKSNYQWQPKPKGPSLRYELILNGAVRKYPDGREVCEPNAQGTREYASILNKWTLTFAFKHDSIHRVTSHDSRRT
jgi:hypothetical protein